VLQNSKSKCWLPNRTFKLSAMCPHPPIL
jgi:hypothetical protein